MAAEIPGAVDRGERRSSAPASPRATAAASLIIAGTLLLQLLAAFDLFPALLGKPTRNFWPFLDYPMYDESAREGDAVERVTLVALCEGGREHVLRWSDFALSEFQFLAHLTTAAQERDQASVASYMRAYRAPPECRTPTAIRVELRPYVLRRNGWVKSAPRFEHIPLR